MCSTKTAICNPPPKSHYLGAGGGDSILHFTLHFPLNILFKNFFAKKVILASLYSGKGVF